MNTEQRIEALEKVAHEPQDIAPRVIEELERATILLRAFVEVPTDRLDFFAEEGLDMFRYFKDKGDPRGVSR